MKRNTQNHPKVWITCKIVGIRRPALLGHLELLWDFTAQYAPQGDIGRYPDDRIEAAMDWSGKRGKLISGLVDGKWVDRDDNHRLLIHDWEDHANESIGKLLQRRKLPFLTARYTGPTAVDHKQDAKVHGSASVLDAKVHDSASVLDAKVHGSASVLDTITTGGISDAHEQDSGKISRQCPDIVQPHARALPLAPCPLPLALNPPTPLLVDQDAELFPQPEIQRLPVDGAGFPIPPTGTSPWTLEQQRIALAQSGWTGIANVTASQEEWMMSVLTSNLTESPDDPRSLYSIIERLQSFNNFWDLYPRHEDRRGTRSKFFSKCRTPNEADAVVAHLENGEAERIADRASSPKFIKHPTTWLNEMPWLEKTEPTKAEDAPLFADQHA